MTTIYNIFDQLSQILAKLDATEIQNLKANETLQNRFNNLAEKSGNGLLSTIEKDELDHYIVLERLIRLAKIRSTEG